jgi:hypothetical protein
LWKRFTLFCVLFVYILAYSARLRYSISELGFWDFFIWAIGAWIAWLIVADLSKFDQEEPSKRGGWRRRYHKSKPFIDGAQPNGSQTVDPPSA